MSPKLPAKGTVTVDIHTRPKQPVDGHTSLPHTLPRVDFGLPIETHPRNPSRATGTPGDVDLDAITPAPPVTASELPSVTVPAPTAAPRPLEHYRVASMAQLPAPDAQGFRTFKGRQYADVPGGGIVPIAADPETGLYRAKLPSELQPSGPVLVRDPESKLWYPWDDFKSTTYPLTATRLEAFRTSLDFTGVEPARDGLYRLDGKLYVVIEHHAYQVLQDIEASSPQTPVMRIVRAEDPVALDDNNLYVATRPGRSEPIVFDDQDGWVGIAVAGAGGMRAVGVSTLQTQFADRIALLRTESAMLEATRQKRLQLTSSWERTVGTEGERTALVLLEVQIRRELVLLEKMVAKYVNESDWLLLVKANGVYRNELHELREFNVAGYNRLIATNDIRKSLEIQPINDPTAAYQAIADYLMNKRNLLEKCQQVANDIQTNSRSSELELAALGYDAKEIHEVTAGWVDARSRLLTDDPDNSDSEAVQLAHSFIEATSAFRGIESIPNAARIAVLTGLLDQSGAIRSSYENLELPPDTPQAASRREITEAIQAFENTLENQIARYHRDRENISALPAQDQPIDFTFIPVQARTGPAPMPRRVFRAKRHGVYKISVGQTRRAVTGEELIDVIDPNNSAQVLRTYERREGEWRRVRPVQNRALPELMAQASQRLEQSDLHLSSARQDERAKRNATNIVEFLGGKAEALDDLARQLEHAPNPTGDTIDGLVQRLRQDSQRLRTEGEEIRIRLYKDKAFLSADRLAYLISQQQISVVKTHSRLERGKGKQKHFLDIYSLNDRHTAEPLWHAHFHYEKKDRPALNFTVKGGHLKTLEQSGSGLSSQRRDEQAGREHVPIWRETIDGRTAQRIFELATQAIAVGL
ncbi:hypothetical protein PS862_00533 [Pseudomonas fluorescens]|uniref:Uncharacterized protein n=1 Tax=Pseudomonas fluorescens TaxID=294 RepID=A0A5E7GVX0_PSEFL|nr:hypothetical protein [Pseudomonas fluorescens]VVO55446.1 hypothetical protein PS862_00533 [Pseudomonas fluorescens]